jgi:hypothetical protein
MAVTEGQLLAALAQLSNPDTVVSAAIRRTNQIRLRSAKPNSLACLARTRVPANCPILFALFA